MEELVDGQGGLAVTDEALRDNDHETRGAGDDQQVAGRWRHVERAPGQPGHPVAVERFHDRACAHLPWCSRMTAIASSPVARQRGMSMSAPPARGGWVASMFRRA